MSRNLAQLPMSVAERIGSLERIRWSRRSGVASRRRRHDAAWSRCQERAPRYLARPSAAPHSPCPLGAWSVTFLADLLELSSMRSFRKVRIWVGWPLV